MKRKVLSMLLCGALAVGIMTGCSTKPAPKEEAKVETEETKEAEETEKVEETEEAKDTTDAAKEATLPAEGNLKTGLGVVTKIASSKAATAQEAGVGQVDSVIAAVTYDAEGVITKCVIDSAQTKVEFNDKGEVQTDLATELKTKNELGDDYGMKKASTVGNEWYEQAQAFADWTVGKKLDEVTGMQVKKVDDSHPAVPDVAELTSSVSISVGDFIAAIEKAMTSAGSEFAAVDSYKTGMGVITSIAKSKSVADGEEGLVQVDSAIVVETLDNDGKILASVMDAAQTKVAFNDKGEITADMAAPISTKVELGDDYGMIKASEIGKEWYQEIGAYSDWTIGKTLDEVKGMQVKAVDESHPAVPDVAELASSVSISVGDYMAGVEKAAANAQ